MKLLCRVYHNDIINSNVTEFFFFTQITLLKKFMFCALYIIKVLKVLFMTVA